MDSILTELLNLPGYSVAGVQTTPDGVLLRLSDARAEGRCRHCGRLSQTHHQTRYRRFRDLAICGRQCELEVPIRRWHCGVCRRVFREPLSFASPCRRFTSRYQAYIYDLVREHNVSYLCRQEGLTYDQIEGIFFSKFGRVCPPIASTPPAGSALTKSPPAKAGAAIVLC